MHIVLIGGSGFGRYHLQAWRKHRDVARLTVVGRNAEHLAALSQEFGVESTTDLAALAEAGLVDICTPPDTHRELAALSLAAGRPTIVEKPPCRTAEQAVELAGEAGDTPLFCVQNQRFSPLWQRVREVVAEGTLGEPRLSLWPVFTDQRQLMSGSDFRADAARGGGALLDGAFHLAYLVPFVLGRAITATSAWAGQLAAQPPAGEDTGLCLWELDGLVAQVTYSWGVANPPRTPAATIIGTEATLLVPRSAREPLELFRERQPETVPLGRWQTASRNDLANCLDHYLGAARGYNESQATWSDAVRAQRVIEATLAAASAGRRMLVA